MPPIKTRAQQWHDVAIVSQAPLCSPSMNNIILEEMGRIADLAGSCIPIRCKQQHFTVCHVLRLAGPGSLVRSGGKLIRVGKHSLRTIQRPWSTGRELPRIGRIRISGFPDGTGHERGIWGCRRGTSSGGLREAVQVSLPAFGGQDGAAWANFRPMRTLPPPFPARMPARCRALPGAWRAAGRRPAACPLTGGKLCLGSGTRRRFIAVPWQMFVRLRRGRRHGGRRGQRLGGRRRQPARMFGGRLRPAPPLLGLLLDATTGASGCGGGRPLGGSSLPCHMSRCLRHSIGRPAPFDGSSAPICRGPCSLPPLCLRL